MATKNAIDSNIPIETSKGGTNATSMATTNGVAYYDGSSIVVTGAGSSTQVLTSNGAGVAPTYQAAGGASGLWNLIQTQDYSSGNIITFSSGISSTYNNYVLIGTQITQSNSGGSIGFQISSDGGSTWKTSGYKSGIAILASATTEYPQTDTFPVTPVIPTSGQGGVGATGAYVWLFNFTSGSGYPTVAARGGGLWRDTGGGSNYSCGSYGMGVYQTAIVVNAIKILGTGGGTLTGGRFSLYGVKN